MPSFRSSKSERDQRSSGSSCPAAWALAVFVALAMLQDSPVVAQISPATLPDLKLSTSSTVFDLAVQEDGKIIISGLFVSVNNVPRTNITRLNPNGSVDLTWNPAIVGEVDSVVASGTNIYLGGSFFTLDDTPRFGLVRVSAVDGASDKNWGPREIINRVDAIAVNGADVYVGGIFDSIGGLARSNIAKLSATGSGAVDPTWNPNANGRVQKLLLNGNDVFAAGDFTSIGGQSRTNLAKLLASGAGAADLAWNAKISGGEGDLAVSGTGSRVSDLVVSGTNLYVSGFFTNVGGVTRPRLAKLSTLGSGLVDANWNPATSTIFLAGPLAFINDALFVTEQRFSENALVLAVAKLDGNGSGARDTNWNATFSGFPPSTLLVTSYGLFAAGNFNLCNNAVSLSLAKLDLVSGARDQDFAAQVQNPGRVYTIARQSDGKVIIGGDFWFAGGLPRQNLARINQDGTFDAFWTPEANGTVQAVAVSGTNIFVGGNFQKVGGLNRTNLAKLVTQGGDAADRNWDARMSLNSEIVYSLVVSDTNLFVAGKYSNIGGQSRLSLAKLSTTGSGDADPKWQADTSFGGLSPGNVYSLALGGTNLFVGGWFTAVKGVSRTNIAKVSALGSGALETNWKPAIAGSPTFENRVAALAVGGTNLFVGGNFTNIGGLPRKGLAKVSTTGSQVVDPAWNPFSDAITTTDVRALAFDKIGTNLYVGANYYNGNLQDGLVRLNTGDTGVPDVSFHPLNGLSYALLVTETGIYVGGVFDRIGGVNLPPRAPGEPRYGFALLPVADAPQLIQDSPTDLFIARNEADGTEVTHFRITGVSGGALYRSDGVAPVNAGDFLTIAEGDAGLKFVPGGTVTAVSALNNTPAGAGTATNGLTMVTNPSPVFKFSATSYSVREGQGSIVVPVRKFGNGTGTVNYATSDLTATGGQDYQTRSGTLNFSATDKVQNLIITIADDLQLEGDEQFAVTLSDVSIGASIAGPATSIVTIVDNDIVGVSDSLTTTVSPTSPPVSTGVLAVSLQPTNAYGQWRLLGELNWHDSGASVSGLVTGNYGVEFRPVNGYFQPQTVTVPISLSVTNTVAFFYAATTNLETATFPQSSSRMTLPPPQTPHYAASGGGRADPLTSSIPATWFPILTPAVTPWNSSPLPVAPRRCPKSSRSAARTRSIAEWAPTSLLHRPARKRRQWFHSTQRRPMSLTSTTAKFRPASASAVALSSNHMSSSPPRTCCSMMCS